LSIAPEFTPMNTPSWTTPTVGSKFFSTSVVPTPRIEIGRGAARALLDVVDDDVRRRVGEILQIDVEATLEVARAQRGDRGADILQVLLALARRDDHFLERAFGAIGGLHRRRSGKRNRNGCRESPVSDHLAAHSPSKVKTARAVSRRCAHDNPLVVD
jgi:hypothetical protein